MISVSMGIEWEFEGLNNYANFQFALKSKSFVLPLPKVATFSA